MNIMLTTYSIYLALSIALTVWVARTLHKNGRAFLVDAFGGREELADSVNHLLVVGFYLVNLGFVCLHLRSYHIETAVRAFEQLAEKMGIVLLVLGGMHFFNLYVLSRFRKRGNIVTGHGPMTSPDYPMEHGGARFGELPTMR